MVFHYTPWNIIFAFGVWLSRNHERIFKTIRSALACLNIFILHTQLSKESSQIKIAKIINWNWKPPFVTLNIDKSTLGNSEGLFLEMAEVAGSTSIGFSTINFAELWAVMQGLTLA